MKNKIKNVIQIAILVVLGIIFAIFSPNDSDILIIDNEFLITFVGVILGIAATIITFIFSSTEKIWGIINSTYLNKEKAVQVQDKFKQGYRELVEDCHYIFVIFVLVIICIIASYIDIPNLAFPNYLPKVLLLRAIKMGLFLNCVVATCDLFFSLINILKLVLYEKMAKK